jgi:tetratricopeptide (TPR) repeat protein
MPARKNFLRLSFCIFMGLAVLSPWPNAAHGQTQAPQPSADYVAKKQQADALFAANNMTDAGKLYEELSTSPDADKDVFSRLGFILFGSVRTTRDDGERKALADRVLALLMRARQLGDNTVVTNSIISSLQSGTPPYVRYSENNEANDAMAQAELLFSAGKMEPAIEYYKKALAADPQMYFAALDIGDCLYKTPGQQDAAQEWFAKAIAINPYSETAYRYWADDLVKLGKVTEARDKYIEAYITEPGNRMSVVALRNFATLNHIALANPTVKVPVKISISGDSFTVTFDPGVMGNAEPVAVPFNPATSPDGYGGLLDPNLISRYPALKAWMQYAAALMLWPKTYLAAHPNEHTVRDNLAEEALAFRAAISGLDPNAADLDPTLATILKLQQDGVLEAFILLVRSNAEIAQDYHQYLTDQRDLLRKYVVNWVITNGGTQK